MSKFKKRLDKLEKDTTGDSLHTVTLIGDDEEADPLVRVVPGLERDLVVRVVHDRVPHEQV